MSKEQEELNKLHKKLHEEWLKHPVTQQAIGVLKKRKEYYCRLLQTNILSDSNPAREQRQRDCMQTAEAFVTILTNSDKFLEYMNQPEKE